MDSSNNVRHLGKLFIFLIILHILPPKAILCLSCLVITVLLNVKGKKLQQIGLNIDRRGVISQRAGLYIKIKARLNLETNQSKCFSNNPFETIAVMRLTISAGHRNPKPCPRSVIGNHIDNHPCPHMQSLRRPHALILPSLPKPHRLGKPKLHALVNCLRP